MYPSAQNYLDQMGRMPQGQVGYPDPYAQQQQGNPYQTGPAAEVPIAEGKKKKGSIARDIAIGVAIAAVVLGGFLLVKFFILDTDDETESASGSAGSSGATTELAT